MTRHDETNPNVNWWWISTGARGHGICKLLKNVRALRTIFRTGTSWDFIEFPSQKIKKNGKIGGSSASISHALLWIDQISPWVNLQPIPTQNFATQLQATNNANNASTNTCHTSSAREWVFNKKIQKVGWLTCPTSVIIRVRCSKLLLKLFNQCINSRQTKNYCVNQGRAWMPLPQL